MMGMLGGDQGGEHARAGDGAVGQAAVVALAFQLRHGQTAEDHIARHGNAGAGTKQGIGAHHGVQ